jgi:hypothetical protein
MRKFGIAQIKNVLKIIKSKLGRFGQWLDEVYNPWMLRILVASGLYLQGNLYVLNDFLAEISA